MGRFKGKRKNNYPHERKNVEEGFIPPAFIEYYHQQFVPETLTEDEFQVMINTFRLPLSHTFRIIGKSSILQNNEKTPPSFDPLRIKLQNDIATFLLQIQARSQSTNNSRNNEIAKSQNEKPDTAQTSNENNQINSNNISHGVNESKITIEKIECLNDMFGEIYRLSADKPSLRRDPALAPLRNWLNIHMKIGNLVRQELVSMVPPFFLDLNPNSRVLDVAAAPGSKTSQILSYVNNGLVVANDVNVTRSTMLVHNLGRLRNLHNEQVIVLSHPAQYLPLFENNDTIKNNGKSSKNFIDKFDRVLCDVPCSGDGTLRKNPDASLKFSLENGAELHPIQRAILIRALKHLKEGGTLVYSTCSLNPIEDEAVISSVVLESKGTVEIKDVSAMFPQMKRSSGIRNWKVLSQFRTTTMYAAYTPKPGQYDDKSNDNDEIDNENDNNSNKIDNDNQNVKSGENKNDNDECNEIETGSNNNDDDDVAVNKIDTRFKSGANKAKFDQECEKLSKMKSNVATGIEHCMRFFPQQNDTGGFFVAVLCKLSDNFDTIIEEPRLSHKPSFKWREHPYYRLDKISPSKCRFLMDSFGLSEEFVSNLFVRDDDENLIRNIYYCSNTASEIVSSIDPFELRAVSCGLRVFTWKEFKDETAIRAIPCIEGVSVLRRNIPDDQERLVLVGVDDMKKLLRSGNDGIALDQLEIAEKLKKLKVGGLLFELDIIGTNIIYGGLLFKDNVLLYVKKEIIEQEIERIDIEIDSLRFTNKS